MISMLKTTPPPSQSIDELQAMADRWDGVRIELRASDLRHDFNIPLEAITRIGDLAILPPLLRF